LPPILGYFGFDSKIYGDTRNRKWWYEPGQERQKDIEIERKVHDGYTEEDLFSS
jgi:hypothetical protein